MRERTNGHAYREFELALPRELTPEQRADLVRSFVAQELGERHAYTFAIHNPIAALDGGEQPHAHVMFSDRKRDGIERDPGQYFRRYNAKVPVRGGCQKEQGSNAATQSERVAERKQQLVALRARWAERTNAHLEQHGHGARVDHRSLAERDIDRTPEPHFGGRGVREFVYRGDVSRLLEQRRAEGELQRAQVEVRTSMLDLSGDLSAARRDRDQRSAGLLVRAEAAKAGFHARLKAQKTELARQAELQRQATVAKDAFRQERKNGFAGVPLALFPVAGNSGGVGFTSVHLTPNTTQWQRLGIVPVAVVSGVAASGMTLFTIALARCGKAIAARTLMTDAHRLRERSARQIFAADPQQIALDWQSASRHVADGYLSVGSGGSAVLASGHGQQDRRIHLLVTIDATLPWVNLIAH